MAKVKIIIKGIAFSYHRDDGVWKVLFPFDNCHTVKLGLSEEDTEMSPLAAANRKINIRVENPVTKFGIGRNYDDFLNLTAEYSHENGVRMKSDWEANSVLMTIENAVLSVNEQTNSKFVVKDDGNVVKRAAVLGYSGRADLEGEKIIIEVAGEDGFTLVFDRDTTLVFDNDCYDLDETREITDMQMLYRVLEDKVNPQKEITVERTPEDMPSVSQKDLEVLPGKDADPFKDFMKNQVFTTNPKTGKPGILCNKCRLSNVADSIGLP